MIYKHGELDGSEGKEVMLLKDPEDIVGLKLIWITGWKWFNPLTWFSGPRTYHYRIEYRADTGRKFGFMVSMGRWDLFTLTDPSD